MIHSLKVRYIFSLKYPKSLSIVKLSYKAKLIIEDEMVVLKGGSHYIAIQEVVELSRAFSSDLNFKAWIKLKYKDTDGEVKSIFIRDGRWFPKQNELYDFFFSRFFT